MSDDRFELEAKVMFLERTLESLHEAMVAQGRQIVTLERRLVRLERKVAERGEPEVGPHDEPPPHY